MILVNVATTWLQSISVTGVRELQIPAEYVRPDDNPNTQTRQKSNKITITPSSAADIDSLLGLTKGLP